MLDVVAEGSRGLCDIRSKVQVQVVVWQGYNASADVPLLVLYAIRYSWQVSTRSSSSSSGSGSIDDSLFVKRSRIDLTIIQK